MEKRHKEPSISDLLHEYNCLSKKLDEHVEIDYSRLRRVERIIRELNLTGEQIIEMGLVPSKFYTSNDRIYDSKEEKDRLETENSNLREKYHSLIRESESAVERFLEPVSGLMKILESAKE